MEIIKNSIKFPVKAEDKTPVVKWKNLEESVRIGKGCLTAMQTGQFSGVTVVDFDVKKESSEDILREDGVAYYERILKEKINTFTVKTRSGGIHMYFKYNKNVKQTQKLNNYTIDTRNDGGYIIVPPSTGYEIINDSDMIEMPLFFEEWINKKAVKTYTGKVNKKDKVVTDKTTNDNEVEKTENFDIKYLKSLSTYDEQKRYFEQYVCFIENIYCYIRKDSDEEIVYYKSDDILMRAYKPIKDFIKEWVEDEDKKTYYKIDFRPDTKNCPANVYNTFKNYWIVNHREEYNIDEYDDLIAPFIEHIKLCVDEDENSFNYVIKLFANKLQRPERKSGISVLMRSSTEGTGKNSVITAFCNILGKEYSNVVQDANEYFDKHSNARVNKLFMVLDEMKGRNGFNNADEIKTAITGDTININPKGQQPYKINNFCDTWFLSNNLTPLDISSSDRRFVVFNVPATRKGDTEYFIRLHKANNNTKNLTAFYDYLMNIKLEDNINWEGDRPITEEYKNIQKKETHLLFLKDELDDLYEQSNSKDKLRASEFLHNYHQWRTHMHYGEDRAMNATLFGRIIKTVTGIEGKKDNKGTYYVINKDIVNKFLVKNDV